jgi:hypothetical protein
MSYDMVLRDAGANVYTNYAHEHTVYNCNDDSHEL